MKNIKGFTLIEVIVTITLLAVLMAIVVPISLSYMDDIQEKKILNEAEAVLSQARSGAQSDRLSLEGKYLSQSGTYTETDSTRLSLYVSNAKGTGVIQNLRYEDGNVTYMKYQYNYSTTVIYTKETNQCVIDNSPSYASVAEAIMMNTETKTIMLNFLSGKAVGSIIHSEAGETNIDIAGYGEKINNVLKNIGFDTTSFSWQVEKLQPKENVNRYQFLITDKKITVDMVGQTIPAMKYIYFEDGTADQSSHTSGEGNFNVKIECLIQLHKTGATEYPVLKRI